MQKMIQPRAADGRFVSLEDLPLDAPMRVRFARGMVAMLREYARINGCSKSSVVRRAVEIYLRVERRNRTQRDYSNLFE